VICKTHFSDGDYVKLGRGFPQWVGTTCRGPTGGRVMEGVIKLPHDGNAPPRRSATSGAYPLIGIRTTN
jgi:hypothetical protein